MLTLRAVLVLSLFSVACGRGGGDDADESAEAEAVRPFTDKAIVLRVPDVCLEGDNPTGCETWLGLRDGKVGTTPFLGRVTFSLEDLDDGGRFHLAVFPDCDVEARAAAEIAQVTPEDTDTPEIGTSTTFRDFDAADADEPLLGDDALAVAPPADDDPTLAEPPILAVSPLAHCKRLMVPPSELGAPVTLVDPAEAGDDSWWVMRFPAEGHPIFVSTRDCLRNQECRIRLLLGDDGFLTAVDVDDAELKLRSFWNKITGRISKGFESIETSVADIKKQVGTAVEVKDIGGKKLFVSAALPAARLYSAVKEQGPEALSLANGTIKDGSMYVKIGGRYVEKGGEAAIAGAKYIGEYIQANICYLGVMSELVSVFGQYATAYEAGLSSGFLAFYNKYSGKMSVENMASDKKSPTYLEMLVFAKVFALHASAISGKYKPTQWENLVMDIILSAFAGDIKAGYTPIIMSKLARAMCKGTDEALSSAHALVSAPSASGLPDDCLQGIRDRANTRYEAGEDLCYATTSEITASAAVTPPTGKLSKAWEGSDSCPKDPNDDAYYNLLEGIGCVKKKVTMDQVDALDEAVVDDTTVLTHSRYWARTTDWHAGLKCQNGAVAIGMCGSGGNLDCFGQAKELLCASRADKPLILSKIGGIKVRQDLSSDYNVGLTLCPLGKAVTQFCSSGANRDCNGKNLVVRCETINFDFAIDYGHCDYKESKAWTGRLDATSPNHVMVGICASGKNPDCGEDSDVTKAALFCPLVPRADDDGIRQVFHFKKSGAHLYAKEIGENPVGWHYKGVAFSLYEATGTGRTPLYSCSSESETFVSTAANCEGANSNGVLGYAPTAATGKPLHRCVDGNGMHLSTTDKATCSLDGFKWERQTGYSL